MQDPAHKHDQDVVLKGLSLSNNANESETLYGGPNGVQKNPA